MLCGYGCSNVPISSCFCQMGQELRKFATQLCFKVSGITIEQRIPAFNIRKDRVFSLWTRIQTLVCAVEQYPGVAPTVCDSKFGRNVGIMRGALEYAKVGFCHQPFNLMK